MVMMIMRTVNAVDQSSAEVLPARRRLSVPKDDKSDSR